MKYSLKQCQTILLCPLVFPDLHIANELSGYQFLCQRDLTEKAVLEEELTRCSMPVVGIPTYDHVLTLNCGPYKDCQGKRYVFQIGEGRFSGIIISLKVRARSTFFLVSTRQLVSVVVHQISTYLEQQHSYVLYKMMLYRSSPLKT